MGIFKLQVSSPFFCIQIRGEHEPRTPPSLSHSWSHHIQTTFLILFRHNLAPSHRDSTSPGPPGHSAPCDSLGTGVEQTAAPETITAPDSPDASAWSSCWTNTGNFSRAFLKAGKRCTRRGWAIPGSYTRNGDGWPRGPISCGGDRGRCVSHFRHSGREQGSTERHRASFKLKPKDHPVLLLRVTSTSHVQPPHPLPQESIPIQHPSLGNPGGQCFAKRSHGCGCSKSFPPFLAGWQHFSTASAFLWTAGRPATREGALVPQHHFGATCSIPRSC